MTTVKVRGKYRTDFTENEKEREKVGKMQGARWEENEKYFFLILAFVLCPGI